MYITKDIVYFPLDINNGIDVIYDKNLKNLLTAIFNDNRNKIIIKV